jgi:hypothetical protein
MGSLACWRYAKGTIHRRFGLTTPPEDAHNLASLTRISSLESKISSLENKFSSLEMTRFYTRKESLPH